MKFTYTSFSRFIFLDTLVRAGNLKIICVVICPCFISSRFVDSLLNFLVQYIGFVNQVCLITSISYLLICFALHSLYFSVARYEIVKRNFHISKSGGGGGGKTGESSSYQRIRVMKAAWTKPTGKNSRFCQSYLIISARKYFYCCYY